MSEILPDGTVTVSVPAAAARLGLSYHRALIECAAGRLVATQKAIGYPLRVTLASVEARRAELQAETERAAARLARTAPSRRRRPAAAAGK